MCVFCDIGNIFYGFIKWINKDPNEINNPIINNKELYSTIIERLKKHSLSIKVLSSETEDYTNHIIHLNEDQKFVLEIKGEELQKKVFPSLSKLDKHLQLNTSVRIQDFKALSSK